jgi:hypothetical protein
MDLEDPPKKGDEFEEVPPPNLNPYSHPYSHLYFHPIRSPKRKIPYPSNNVIPKI